MNIEIDNMVFNIIYVPGRNTSILIDCGENEDEVIFKYVTINNKKSKVTEELYEDYYDLVLEEARNLYEQVYFFDDEESDDDDHLTIIKEEEYFSQEN